MIEGEAPRNHRSPLFSYKRIPTHTPQFPSQRRWRSFIILHTHIHTHMYILCFWRSRGGYFKQIAFFFFFLEYIALWVHEMSKGFKHKPIYVAPFENNDIKVSKATYALSCGQC